MDVGGTIQRNIPWLATCAMLCACAKSGGPSVSDLVALSPPSFTGVSVQGFLTTPSEDTTLNGTCSPKSFELQYSTDGESTWNTIDGACSSSGTFSIQVHVTKTLKVSVRARSKLSYTASASVTVRYLLPATSPAMTMLASARSDDEGASHVQSAMGTSFDGAAVTDGSIRIGTYLPGMTYATP